MEIKAWLDKDGKSFWFTHECAGRPDLTERGQPEHTHLTFGPGRWQLVSKDPLTVTPSIQCLDCPTHGYITNGEWVSV